MLNPKIAVVAVLSVLLLVGCGGPQLGGSGTAVGLTGNISGHFEVGGGLPPGFVIRHGTIWVLRGRVDRPAARPEDAVAHVNTSASGSFKFRLPVGTYSFYGSEGFDTSNFGGTWATPYVVATVTAAQPTTIRLTLSIP